MLRVIQIDRYRGIPRCVAQGLGRVNLVIGKHDCGKTAFMEALELADEAENAAHILFYWQQHRLGRTTRGHDFERFWRPMFFGFDAKAGFSVSVERDDGTSQAIDVRQGTGWNPVVPEEPVDGVLDPPVKGRFTDGVGTFYSDSVVDGKTVRTRFVWSHITPKSARWEQAMSSDLGKTWDTNWVMEFSRVE